ncbi:hypothetical protein [Segetibacter aerophilus]|nr:hypothetical protein [Segetibacter aerophilus]
MELRKGNWVLSPSPVQVETIGYEGINIDSFGKTSYPFEKLAGIPITRELLEEAHFIEGEKEFQGYIMSVLEREGKMEIYTFEDKTTLIEFPCQYVHQLQNLHFHLMGDELPQLSFI